MSEARLARPSLAWRLGPMVALLLGLLLGQGPAPAGAAAAPAVTGLTLAPDRPSGQPVGVTVTWTATAADPAGLEYRFSVAQGDQLPVVVRDFARANTVTWMPLAEGTYQVRVEARDPAAGATATASAAYTIVARVTAGRSVVSATANPLVALYSIPPCGAGTVQTLFGTGDDMQTYQRTSPVACSPTVSENVYLVGMRPTTTYTIRYVVTDGGAVRYGPLDTWTTGAIPADQQFPQITTPVPPTASASLQDGIVFHAVAAATLPHQVALFATDLQGRIVWYYPAGPEVPPGGTARPLPGGDILAQLSDPSGEHQILRIMDPAGNPVRETSLDRINEQLAGRSGADQIAAMTHEATLLPDGHILVLGSAERLFPPGTQGSTTGLPVDIVADEIIVLDQNLQVSWVWDGFDFLDINRAATLGDVCHAHTAGCPPLANTAAAGGTAQDWMHANAVIYSPADHDLLLSVRHQDWILKLDYHDGAGDGHIVWRLGNGGDFTLTNPPAGDPFPWFSHQHGLALNGDMLATFDNGNTRCNGQGPSCHSRGQVYRLDEAHHTATLILDADMGDYSDALGWAQLLQNGDYAFTSGFQQANPPTHGQVEEFAPDGRGPIYVLQDLGLLYRGYRMTTMYDGCCGAPAAIPPTPPAPTTDGAAWTAVGGTLGDAPAAAGFAGRAYIFVRGARGALLMTSTADGTTFAPWVNLGGVLTAAPTAASADGTLYVFARGADDALYVRTSTDGHTFTPWRSLGGRLTSAPAAAGAGRTLVVGARDSAGGLAVRVAVDGAFGPWRAHGGALAGAPVAAAFQGTLIMLVQGPGHTLYATAATAGTGAFGPYRALGPSPAADLAAVALTPAGGPETLVLAGRAADGTIHTWHSTDGATFTAGADLAGRTDAMPAVAALDTRLFVVVRGADGGLWVRTSDGK
ncbi:MAG TPA: aryl-sulfate sulfotransferase [Thermomicrobiales bacterium]|nr:aryl-sulfate sulfotransferase [Thermomicrobiales bacterium]